MQPNRNIVWEVRKPVSQELAPELAVYRPVIRQLLFNRGLTTVRDAEIYLNPENESEHEPLLMTGIESAVSLLLKAIDAGESVAVYGDYDADGVTATALLVMALKKLGAAVEGYIPHRFEEGYGLNNAALDELKSRGNRVVITVDCGVRSLPEAAYAREMGLDLIISDHHTCGADLPQAAAIINPHQPGDAYPDKNLAGVGLAYKLARALVNNRPAAGINPDQWLDLVALGTIADMVPLTGENRHLVSKGLKQINAGWRPGIRSLANTAGKELGKINAHDVGYTLAPRLNAAGRLDTARTALELLTSQDAFEIARLAQKLDDMNRDRQEKTRDIQSVAEQMVLALPEGRWLAYVESADFNAGIVGLAASRLLDSFYRPAIAATINSDETIRASCRSIPGFHITEALDQCSQLLIRHGGHSAAAGFTVLKQNKNELISRLEAIAAERFNADPDLLTRKITADMRLPLKAIDFPLLQELDCLQPVGMDNPDAVFLAEGVDVIGKWAVGNGSHLSLRLSQAGSPAWKAIAFQMGAITEKLPARVDVIYGLKRDEFRGTVGIQMMVKAIAPAGEMKIRNKADSIPKRAG